MGDPITRAKVRAHVALAVPRRDWRFWAAIAAVAMTFSQLVAFNQILSDRNHWRDRFDEQRTEQLCRSAAGADVSAALAGLVGQMADNQITIDRGLGAVAAGDDQALAAMLTELGDRIFAVAAARDALTAAVEAQQLALRTCQPELPPTTSPSTNPGG